MESGVYRLTDSNGDDQLDRVEKLRGMEARGDHGVHALILSPEKKSMYLITGNNTTPVEANRSRVPMDWGEDHLLPRMPDGHGHNRDRLAPAESLEMNWLLYETLAFLEAPTAAPKGIALPMEAAAPQLNEYLQKVMDIINRTCGGWESFSGTYWFATEIEEGTPKRYYGLDQGDVEE